MSIRVGRSDIGAKPFEVMLHLGRFSIGFNIGLKHFYYRWMTDLGLGIDFYWAKGICGTSQHMVLNFSLLLVDLRFIWNLTSKEGQ